MVKKRKKEKKRREERREVKRIKQAMEEKMEVGEAKPQFQRGSVKIGERVFYPYMSRLDLKY